MRERALTLLRTALGRPDADFRPGQWESIDALVKRNRLLVVQRTGWGKSMVYFLTTRLLRDEGAGVTLLISPLLSLMRNQLAAAARVGIRAETINSANTDDWREIEDELRDGKIDILLVSPERLANDKFRENVLARIARRVGLFVVDEAHCISDWGHDFRPDYRRIVRVLQALPPNVPVLATTATANDRVVKDVLGQLGDGVELVRGPLVRSSLKLQNTALASPAARMAWLAEWLPKLPGSGIVYTLTQRDARRVAEWLCANDIAAEAYHADLPSPKGAPPVREQLERMLLANEVKALVATVALGMGFDKPDLGFVVHFQRPASVVHYYQQVGRAGRAVDEAYGILLHGEEDDRIASYFITNAFPPQHHVSDILDLLDEADGGLSLRDLERDLNLRYTQLTKALKFLSVESPSPVAKIGSKWNVTAAARSYRLDHENIAKITSTRRDEQQEMRDYMAHEGCLMEFLGRALDDPAAGPCGKCAGCRGEPVIPTTFDPELANRAAIFLRRSYQPIKPRLQWPPGDALPRYRFAGRIGPDLRASEGRALSLWRDAGWGALVAAGKCGARKDPVGNDAAGSDAAGKDAAGPDETKHDTARFDDDLVSACVLMLADWAPDPAPRWIACVPSRRRPTLVADFAERLATALDMPFSPCLTKARDNPQQRDMQNSFQQAHNLDVAFGVKKPAILDGPCLLVDDEVDSRWTFTVTAALLRRAGCPAVFPLALALNSPRMD